MAYRARATPTNFYKIRKSKSEILVVLSHQKYRYSKLPDFP